MAHDIARGLDLAEGLVLSRAIGWETSERALRDVLALAGPGAFTARDASGAPVGMVTCVVWPSEAGALAWIGMMVVAERARGQGLGRALLRSAVGHARAEGATTIALDATEAGRALYASEGFVAHGESVIWKRAGERRAPLPPSGEFAIYPVSSAEIMELLAYDAPRFGASRARWLAQLVGEEPHRSFVAVHRRTGAFSGLALSLQQRIGPLVAESPAAAAWLLHAAEAAGAPGALIAAGWNPHAEAVLRDAGYAPGLGCTRMTLGGPMPGRPANVYGIGGWALG